MQKPTPKNPFKRGPSWLVQYREEVRLPSGKTSRPGRTRTLAPCKGPGAIGKREADQLAWDQIFQPLNRRQSRPGSLATVREFYEQKYAPDVMATFKKHGREDRASVFTVHVLPAIGDTPLRHVDTAAVKKLLSDKLATGLSTQRVKHIRNAIGSLFRYAREERCFSGELPTEFRWRVPMQRVRPRGSLTFEQARLLIEHFAGRPALAALVRFLVVSGCRISEALGLRWQNLNLTAETISGPDVSVPPHAAAIVEAWTRSEYTTVKREGAHERIIPLPLSVLDALRALREASGFTAPGDPVFAGSTGKPLDAHNYLVDHLKPAVAAVNARIEAEGLAVPKLPEALSWHWFRHANASFTDQAGMTAVERRKVLGHASDSMTMLYSHADVEAARRGIELVDQRLSAGGADSPRRERAGNVLVFTPSGKERRATGPSTSSGAGA